MQSIIQVAFLLKFLIPCYAKMNKIRWLLFVFFPFHIYGMKSSALARSTAFFRLTPSLLLLPSPLLSLFRSFSLLRWSSTFLFLSLLFLITASLASIKFALSFCFHASQSQSPSVGFTSKRHANIVYGIYVLNRNEKQSLGMQSDNRNSD